MEKEVDQGPYIEQALETSPTIFVDGAVGFVSVAGVVRLNLYQDVLAADPAWPAILTRRKIVARLAMPVSVAEEIQEWLTRLLHPEATA